MDSYIIKESRTLCENGSHGAKYFILERVARQEDPISAYLFILVLETLFIFIKLDKSIDGINTLNH